MDTSTPRTKHPIPPTWYNLQTTNSHPYISLPTTAHRPPIFLTTFYSGDAPALQAILSLPPINASLISVPHPYTLDDAHFWINLQRNPDSSSRPWLQALRKDDPGESGTFIGAVSLTPSANLSYRLSLPRQENADASLEAVKKDEVQQQQQQQKYEQDSYILGYYLHPAYHHHGIMRDAVGALIAWGVAQKGVRNVHVNVAVENFASRAVVEGIEGFERVAGEMEVRLPEEKGGGVERVWSWVWKFEEGRR